MELLSGLSHHDIIKIDRDNAEVARSVRLLYVNDSSPGIKRVRRGKGFAYIAPKGQSLDQNDLERIRKLVLPPAWTNVWICSKPNGHIQATGFDKRGRKQYRYHSLWSQARSETKFHRLYEFGKTLPTLRLRVERDLAKKELCQEKVIAIVISLMERTYIRIGNDDYEKLYGSHGITTLKNNHIQIKGSEIRFSFTGKKQVTHQVSLKNRRLANAVKQCRDIPGKELFQYYDENGVRHPIDSGMVNEYIKETTNTDYTAKDFRTWAGSLSMLRAFNSLKEAASQTAIKQNIITALDEVSRKLGNTRSVCRKYYVHPKLIELYEQNALTKYMKQLDDIEIPDHHTDLTDDEKTLMRILKAVMV